MSADLQVALACLATLAVLALVVATHVHISRRRYRATHSGDVTAAYLADPDNFYPGAHGQAALDDRGTDR